MSDDQSADDNQRQGGRTRPPAPAIKTDQPPENGESGGHSRPPSNGRGPNLRFIRELNTNERLTAFLAFCSLLVAAGSFAVAILTFGVASDTRDIKSAIKNLSELATQTKRQADGMGNEVGEMRNQTSAIEGEIEQLRRQADNTEKRVRPAQQSANAATREVADQERQFRMAQRPIID